MREEPWTDCNVYSKGEARSVPERAAEPRTGEMMNEGPAASVGRPDVSAAAGTTSCSVSGDAIAYAGKPERSISTRMSLIRVTAAALI